MFLKNYKLAKTILIPSLKYHYIYKNVTAVPNLVRFKNSVCFHSRNYSCGGINNSIESHNETVNITLNDKLLQYPFVWLRDNCQCDKCFHRGTQSRVIQWETFNIESKPLNINNKQDSIEIHWDDGHISEYNHSWLEERSFNLEARDKYTFGFYEPKRMPWSTNDFPALFKSFEYNKVLQENSTLYEWLQNLHRYGVALITDVPAEKDSCRKLANRVGFIKKTHYGEEFIVEAKPKTTNQAYTSNKLQLHIDVPAYQHKPGANLLHCYTQADNFGGENILSDGLYVANYLKQNEKHHYDLLSKILVDWQNIGDEDGQHFHCLYRAPVICENAEGLATSITYSVTQRGSFFNVPVDKVKSWYSALKRFVDLMHKNAAYFRMTSGQLLTFDNTRMVHGRSEYQDSSDIKRYVIGAYLDWDVIKSKMRVLYKQNK